MKLFFKTAIMAMFLASPLLTSAQYFQALYDIDSAQDWGWNIFVTPDGNYLINGAAKNYIFNVTINSSTLTKMSEQKLAPADSFASLYQGTPGEMKLLPGGNGYLMPMTIQWPDTNTHYFYSAAGITKFNSSVDTLFVKTYTDTAIYFDAINCGNITLGGLRYLIGGSRSLMNDSNEFNFPALIICTDTSGNILWNRTYQKVPSQFCDVINMVALSDGRIAVCASSSYLENPGPNEYWHNTPWFFVTDSVGNILKDTVYGRNYIAIDNFLDGSLYADKNGGYVWIGRYDSVYNSSNLDDANNFPGFIAHLDTNFRIIWLTPFVYMGEGITKDGGVVKQLHDSSYLVIGESWMNPPRGKGFAARVSRTGEILWSNTYYSDSMGDSYFRDGAERPDGSIVLTGQAWNDTLSPINQKRDLWLVGVDSNGCETMNCGITRIIAPSVLTKEQVKVYPNPTNGNLTVKTPVSGVFTFYSLLGQVVNEYALTSGESHLRLPANLAAGMYLGEFKPDIGAPSSKIRIVYQP